MDDNISVTALTDGHAHEWRKLFSAYANFYQQPMSDEVLNTVWRWILQGQIHGLGAHTDSRLLGIAHWHINLRPLVGGRLAYLNDLFVHPDARGQSIGKKLVDAAAAQAKAQGCPLLRWATAADNTQAQALYDNIATKTTWVIYDKMLISSNDNHGTR
ncbi:GNAT family N-acetyltransferase [Candidatus Persebacteraceae bacterium Df01]|jgi:ribosomal protein S18 acetylase RimI-like enzyme|uniref:GNAT family N-acetyltransferase n=1 Tax=Candidatus Doriopsillibacter californiensis TaxID=2970740 RepID=A0ABT7QKX7_9GAMM|nr:GNAT family N-acetyltransferase [Candidatus Persebacteraceae bacterium Df01]